MVTVGAWIPASFNDGRAVPSDEREALVGWLLAAFQPSGFTAYPESRLRHTTGGWMNGREEPFNLVEIALAPDESPSLTVTWQLLQRFAQLVATRLGQEAVRIHVDHAAKNIPFTANLADRALGLLGTSEKLKAALQLLGKEPRSVDEAVCIESGGELPDTKSLGILIEEELPPKRDRPGYGPHLDPNPIIYAKDIQPTEDDVKQLSIYCGTTTFFHHMDLRTDVRDGPLAQNIDVLDSIIEGRPRTLPVALAAAVSVQSSDGFLVLAQRRRGGFYIPSSNAWSCTLEEVMKVGEQSIEVAAARGIREELKLNLGESVTIDEIFGPLLNFNTVSYDLSVLVTIPLSADQIAANFLQESGMRPGELAALDFVPLRTLNNPSDHFRAIASPHYSPSNRARFGLGAVRTSMPWHPTARLRYYLCADRLMQRRCAGRGRYVADGALARAILDNAGAGSSVSGMF